MYICTRRVVDVSILITHKHRDSSSVHICSYGWGLDLDLQSKQQKKKEQQGQVGDYGHAISYLHVSIGEANPVITRR